MSAGGEVGLVMVRLSPRISWTRKARSTRCRHEVARTGSAAAAARTPAFKRVNTALGSIRAAITGTCRSISQKHVPRSPAEFEYRCNRRHDLAAMLPRLTRAAVQTPPMPCRMLTVAEVSAE